MCLIFFGHIKSVNYSLLPILSSYSQLGWTQVIPPPKKKKKKYICENKERDELWREKCFEK
jgi:hypothetical protein